MMDTKAASNGKIHPQPSQQTGQKTSAKDRLKEEVSEFCCETSAHGLSQVVKGSLWTPVRIVWFFIFLLAMGGNAYHLSVVIQEYLRYPTQEVTTLSPIFVRFPHVTVCNQVPMSLSAAAKARGDPQSGLSQYEALLTNLTEDLLVLENQTGIALDDILGSPPSIASNLPISELIALGHTEENLILSCKFQGADCDMVNDFKMVTSSDYINCYTFTGDASVGINNIAAGPRNGLSLVLYLENSVAENETKQDGIYNIYSSTENNFGIRIEIHENNTLPNPAVSGFGALPGHSTDVSLRAKKISKLGGPHYNCSPDTSLQGAPGYAYSLERCLDFCMTSYVFTNCGCVDNTSPIPDYIQPGSNQSKCTTLSPDLAAVVANMQCSPAKAKEFNNDATAKTSCGCQEACERMEYDILLSQSRWPAKSSTRDMYSEFVSKHPNKINLTAYHNLNQVVFDDNITDEMLELIHENFARINVYFRDTNVIDMRETASYSFGSLWSNIGGTIGLWAGLSVITLVEFITFPIKLCFINGRKTERPK